MARVPLIQEQERPELADMIERFRVGRRGKLINIYRMLLNAPPLAESWFNHSNTVRWKTTLPGRLREIVIVRMGHLTKSYYVLRQHVPSLAVADGLSLEECDALSDWRASRFFTASERAALAYADTMTREIAVPDAIFAEVDRHFNAREIVELTVLIGTYNMNARVLQAPSPASAAAPAVSKAFRFHEHGGPEVLRFEDAEVGAPGPGEVRIRNVAVAVNYRDVLMRRGVHAVKSLPSAIGLESAGLIEALGPGVNGFAVGDRVVYAGMPEGSYAELRIVPAARLIALPAGIDERTAASMMIRGMTARCLLHDTYKVQRDDTILIHAAAGGVGLIMCQWAKHLGATVIGTVSSDEKAAVARAHGCDHPIVYTREDFAARVREITGGEGVPVVYDSVGKATFEESLKCLRRRGVMASFGEASGDPDPMPPRRLGALGSIYLTHPSVSNYTAT